MSKLSARGPQWQAARKEVLDRDGWRCTQCGKAGRIEVDHIRPLHRGGELYELANLRTLCRSCHIRITADQNRREQTPAEARWQGLVRELL